MTRIAIILLVCLSWSLSAQQSARKTVILYNIVPVDASIAPDGEIMEIYGKNESYLRGYTIVKQDKTIPAADPTTETTTDPSINGLYRVVKDNYNLTYTSGKATLSRDIIRQLDGAADAVFLYPANKILITPYAKEGLSSRDKVLYDNRLKSILSYLEIKGLSKNQVLIDQDQTSKVADQIIVTIIE